MSKEQNLELIKLINATRPTGRMGNNNEPVWNAEKVYDLMVKAQQQVKSVDLADVVGRSEQLKMLEHIRHIKGLPIDVQITIDKMYLSHL